MCPDAVPRLPTQVDLPEELFNDLAQFVQAICPVPYVIITVAATGQRWSNRPLDQATLTYLASLTADATEPLPRVVDDLARAAGNEAAAHDLAFRFLAHFPCADQELPLQGALILLDPEPRQLAPRQFQELQTLARLLTHRLVTLQQGAAALLGGAAQLRLAARVGHFGAWVVNLTDQSTALSDEVRTVLGLTAGENLTLEDAFDFFPPEERPAVRAAFEACAQHGMPFDVEAPMITPEGEQIWVRAVGEAIRNADGTITHVHGAFHNITTQQEAVASLQQSEQRFRDLADAMPIIVWTATPDGLVDYVNRTFFEYAGMETLQFPTDRWLDALHPNDIQPTLTVWQRALQTSTPYVNEFRLRRAVDGAYHWHLVRAVPIRNDDGEIIKWYGSAIDVHDTKVTEETARRLAERLSTTLESITDAFFTLDHEWRFTYLNRQAELLLQRDRSELLGKSIWDEFAPAVNSNFDRQYRHAIATQSTVEVEDYYPPLDRWFNARAFPTPEGLAVYFRDVTDAHLARQTLLASEERFRLVARATNDAIWDWDLVSDTVWWSDGYEQLFGYTREDAPDGVQSWMNFIHPSDRDRVWKDIHRAIDEGEDFWEHEYRFIRKDGSIAEVLDRGYVIRDADGVALRMLGGMTDLTSRNQAERRLREQAALLDQAHDAILVRALDHTITYWNAGAARLYGWSAEEVQGRSVIDLLYRDTAMFHDATNAVLIHGEWSGELTQHRRDGEEILVEARWTLLHDAEGTPQSILAINTDITQRKKLEMQFLRAQRLESIGVLAGGIAHDLNNILTPILLTTFLLKKSNLSARDLERIHMIEENANRATQMVRQVLTFARGVEGQRVPVQLGHIAQEVVKLMQETLDRQIKVSLEIENAAWPVLGDATQLHQVLVNLCINARDAMPAGGTLHIQIENLFLDEQFVAMHAQAAPGPYVLLTVADSGTGIPKSIIDKIFDPFFTTKETNKGTGLGLSTVLGIVQAHNGFLNVYSEEGQGAVFKIFLPATSDAAQSAAQPRRDFPAGNGELILVVDDESPVRAITQQTLEAFGYRVVVAEDGAQAISIYVQRQAEIAVVLTDMMMPVMDGYATIQALIRINPNVKIIAASGLASNGMVAKAASAGVAYFLPKPYTADAMLAILAKALGKM